MYCPNCNELYTPTFIESGHYAKADNSCYKLYHQECAYCHLIIVGVYEFKLNTFATDLKVITDKIKFLKH